MSTCPQSYAVEAVEKVPETVYRKQKYVFCTGRKVAVAARRQAQEAARLAIACNRLIRSFRPVLRTNAT